MDEKKLLAFFKSGKINEKSHWGCLDETQIAAYTDHRLTGQAREQAETHLADCDACLAQVAFLIRSQPAGSLETAPPWLILRAKKLTQKEARAGGSALWHWGKFAAAAACLALVAVVMLRRPTTIPTNAPQQYPIALPQQAPGQTTPTPPGGQIGVPKVRGGQKIPLSLTVVNPSTASENEIEFHWSSVSGALDYDVQVMTAEGDLVWKQQTIESSSSLPGKVKLEAGRQYFVLVRAYLTEGKSVESRPVAFTATIRK